MLPFHFKSTVSFSQQFKKFIQTKSLDIQAQCTLFHLNPQSQDIIVLIDGSYQLINILIFLPFDFLIIDKAFPVQFMHFVDNTVYIRMNTVDNGHTCFLHQILTFVSGNMLLINITLLFQPPALVSQRDGSHAIIQCPLYIRSYYLHHCQLILAHVLRQYQPTVFNTDIFHSEQIFHFGSYCRLNGIYDLLLCPCIRRDGCRYLLADIQHFLQTVQMYFILYFGTFVKEPEEQEHQHKARHYKEEQGIQLG